MIGHLLGRPLKRDFGHSLSMGVGYQPPVGMGWPSQYAFTAQRSGPAWVISLQPRSLVNAAIWTVTPCYVSASTGANANDGLTPATAKRDINAAITTANADGQTAICIYVAAGDYFQGNSINGNAGTVEPTKPYALIATGGRVRHMASTGETFPATKGPTYLNSFIGGPSSANRVFDRLNLDANGDYTELTNAADAAAVDATPNSWVVSSVTGSSKVHIRRSDGLQPTAANTLVTRNISVAAMDSCTSDTYIEGFDFEGGPFGALWIDPVSTRNVVVVNCSASYAGTAAINIDGFRIRRVSGLVFLLDCKSVKNWKDGLNFHSDGSAGMCVLAVNCIGRSNGKSPSVSNNGFTTHDDVKACVIGGDYRENIDGADFHCIESTKTWALGTNVKSIGVGSAAFKFSDAGSSAWLENCTGQAVTDAIYAQGAAVFIRSFTNLGGAQTADSGGSITAY